MSQKEEAACLWQAGKLQEAWASYMEIFYIESSNAIVLTCLGTLAHQMGNYNDAIYCFDFAVSLGYEDASLFNNFGESYRALGRLGEAAHWFRLGLKKNPTMALLHNNLGLVHLALRQFDKAISCFKQAIDLQPGYHKAHRNMGRALQDMKLDRNDLSSFEFGLSHERWPKNSLLK